MRLIVAGCLAIVVSSQPAAGGETIPALGTLEWAEAVEQARIDDNSVETAHEHVATSRRLLALYHGCTACTEQVYRMLEYRLNQVYRDENALRQIQEVEYAHDPVSLGRLFARTGRPREAKRIATAELQRTRFLERRLELLEVLAEAEANRGNLRSARKIAKRLLDETPVSPSYCEKALHWMTWLGEEPLPNEGLTVLAEYPEQFRRIRDLERERGNDPYVSCLFNHYLLSWNRDVSGMKRSNVPVDHAVLALFPDGIDSPQQELARRASNPKVRAAILVSAAGRVSPHVGPVTLRLSREANAAGGAPSIRAGAQRMELTALGFSEQRSELETLAAELIDRFPNSEASCEACVHYWYALTYPWPQFSNRIPEWQAKCLRVINDCPDRIDRWRRIVSFYGSPGEHAAEVYGALLAMRPPDEVIPMVLLRLSAALRQSDPKQAWSIEREAIRHPQFPGIYYAHEDYSQLRAESNGDFETALYLELLKPRPNSGSCVPGDHSIEIGREFRRGYLQLRLSGEPGAHWNELIGLLPTTPEDGSSRGLLRDEYLDRVLEEARAGHKEGSALDWFRTVRQHYRAELGDPRLQDEHGWSESELRNMESLLDGYIERLEKSVQ